MVKNGPNRKTGFYMEHSGAEQYLISGIDYYATEPSCNYRWVPSKNGETVANAIKYNSQYQFYIGRIKEGNSWHVGKVVVGTNFYMCYGKGHCGIPNYEVLICEKKTSPIEPVAPEKCTKSMTLYSKTGSPLKSLCLIEKSSNYQQAISDCANVGMELFIVNSQEVNDAFLKEVNEFYSQYDYARLWVNGRKNAKGEYSPNAPTQTSFYSGASWFENNNAAGECLSVLKNQKSQSMALSGWKCDGVAYTYCEFISEEQIPKETTKSLLLPDNDCELKMMIADLRSDLKLKDFELQSLANENYELKSKLEVTLSENLSLHSKIIECELKSTKTSHYQLFVNRTVTVSNLN
jgi:hypothetical protein